jgi:signal transduction histidine kinase
MIDPMEGAAPRSEALPWPRRLLLGRSVGDHRPPSETRTPWYAPISWKGAGILVAICAVNALRRNISSSLLHEDLVGWMSDVTEATLTGLVVGVLVIAAVLLSLHRIPPRSPWTYAAALLAAVAASLAGSLLLAGYDSGWTFRMEIMPGSQVRAGALLLMTWPRYLVLSCSFAVIYCYLRERRDAEAELRRLDAERAAFEQRTAEARLHRLQAQIEPHFLFNTLAHVKRLYQTDALSGRTMLDNLMRYLSQALPQMREPQSTVQREFALTAAYLDIQKIRMGPRLQFSLDMDADVAGAQLPPMMLLTLAENSIKHGVSPLPEGGTVRVHARREGNRLVIDVVDTGRGFTAESGTGTGLANTRARLTTLHGDAATLTLNARWPHGVEARLSLPFISRTQPPS